MRLLLPASTNYSQPQAAAVINNHLAALTASVQNSLHLSQPSYPASSVSFLSAAVAATPLPDITATGPSPVSNNAAAPGPSQSAPVGVGYVVAIIVAIIAAVLIISIIITRFTGSCFGAEVCCVALATCCGACPLGGRSKKPVSKSPSHALAASKSNLPSVDGQQHADTILNPMSGALALRSVQPTGSFSSPATHRPSISAGYGARINALPSEYLDSAAFDLSSPEHGSASRSVIGASV